MDPFFSADEHAIDKAFIPAHLLAVGELVEKGAPEIQEHLGFSPLFEAAMDCRFGAVPFGQFAPGGASPENPEDAFKAFAVIERRSPSLSRTLGFRQLSFNELPLFIGDGSPSHGCPPWFGKLSQSNYLSTYLGMTS